MPSSIRRVAAAQAASAAMTPRSIGFSANHTEAKPLGFGGDGELDAPLRRQATMQPHAQPWPIIRAGRLCPGWLCHSLICRPTSRNRSAGKSKRSAARTALRYRKANSMRCHGQRLERS